jgi:hypothetical protein
MEAAFQLLSPSEQAETIHKNAAPPFQPTLFTKSATNDTAPSSATSAASSRPEAEKEAAEREGGSLETEKMLRGDVEADEMMEVLEEEKARKLEAEAVGQEKTIEDLMEEEKKRGVSVGQDDLFEVDVKEMKVRLPIYRVS